MENGVYPKTRTGPHLISRFVIPANAATIHPRIIGYKSLTVWSDDFSLLKEGNVKDWLGSLPKEITLENPVISVNFNVNKLLLSVTDKRNGKKMGSKPFLMKKAFLKISRSKISASKLNGFISQAIKNTT